MTAVQGHALLATATHVLHATEWEKPMNESSRVAYVVRLEDEKGDMVEQSQAFFDLIWALTTLHSWSGRLKPGWMLTLKSF